MDQQGNIYPNRTYAYQVETFPGANIDPAALAITNIDPTYPLRFAIPEKQALFRLFNHIQNLLDITECQRAVLVGHNAWFDLTFLQKAFLRSGLAHNPLHSF